MNRFLWLLGLTATLCCAHFSNCFLHLHSSDHGEPATTIGQQNFEELGSYLEGDILFPVNKNALVAKIFRWPRNKVPYVLNGNFTPQDLAAIQWAFDQFNNRTCVHFQQRFKEKDYISIVSGNSGCWSNAGRVGGKQEVNLQSPECFLRRGTVLHEFMHALGFMHEHNRHDRDIHIIVHMDNVKDNQAGSFVKLPKRSANGMGLRYDYSSVMHYSSHAFSKNGQPTIEAKKTTNDAKSMGQRSGFSSSDVTRINLMYKCR